MPTKKHPDIVLTRTNEYTFIPNELLTDHRISETGKVIFCLLASFIKNKNKNNPTIQECMNSNIKQIQMGIKELIKYEWINSITLEQLNYYIKGL